MTKNKNIFKDQIPQGLVPILSQGIRFKLFLKNGIG